MIVFVYHLIDLREVNADVTSSFTDCTVVCTWVLECISLNNTDVWSVEPTWNVLFKLNLSENGRGLIIFILQQRQPGTMKVYICLNYTPTRGILKPFHWKKKKAPFPHFPNDTLHLQMPSFASWQCKSSILCISK